MIISVHSLLRQSLGSILSIKVIQKLKMEPAHYIFHYIKLEDETSGNDFNFQLT